MGSLDEIYHFWNNVYDWSRYQGDEWSARWGGADMQWYWEIYPRIRRHLPASTILEIGPGHGRFSEYLKPFCQSLILVDISERCIHACKERLGEDGVVYKVGDGLTLTGVKNASVDFCFSFESLVQSDTGVLEANLAEVARVLSTDGFAFLHHSNLGAFPLYFRFKDLVPKKLRRPLKRRGWLDYDEMRAPGVTADWFERAVLKAGLHCHTQELIPWGGKRLIDCISVIGKQPPPRGNKVVENPNFTKRAYEIQRLSWLYGEGVPW